MKIEMLILTWASIAWTESWAWASWAKVTKPENQTFRTDATNTTNTWKKGNEVACEWC